MVLINKKEIQNTLKEIIFYNWNEDTTYIEVSDLMQVEVDTFLRLFKDAKEVSYNELKRIDEENNYGYSEYFDKWKEQGILS